MTSSPQLCRGGALLAALALVCLHTGSLAPARAATTSGPVSTSQADYYLRDYQLITLDPNESLRQVRGSGWLHIPVPSGPLTVALGKRDLRGPGYREETTHGDGATRRETRREVKTYAGVVPELGNAGARFTVDEHGVSGIIVASGETYFLEPLGNFALDAGPTDYVFYRGSDVRPEAMAGTCAATEAGRVEAAAAKIPATSEVVTTDRVVQIATEADNEFVANYASATAANDDIMTVLNQVEGVYQAELGLTFDVVMQHAWATGSSDPYSGTDPSTTLAQYRDYWNANYSNITRDVAHMWTGRDMDGSTIGIAYVAVVCNNPSYSYGVSQRYTSSPQRHVLTSHEIGHNFSACHSDTSCNPNTGSCSNTIMQSFVGTGMTFCQFSRNQINAHVNANSSCLATAVTSSPTTVGLYAGTTGTFFLKNTNTPGAADVVFGYGPANATAIVGDWDGNSTTTVGVYTPGTGSFFLRNSNSAGSASMSFNYGPAGAVPVAGDWDGNGTETVGVYVGSTSTFFLRNAHSAGPADVVVSFGPASSGWQPVVGDWNGDGRDTIGLYNPATGSFFLKNANTPGAADIVFSFGPAGASPIAGDWSGTGFDSVGIYIPSTAVFFLRNSNSPGNADVTVVFGAPPITGVVGNWDGV